MLGGPEARKYFETAISTAPDDKARADANRAMAMSWAFESNCQMTVLYEQKALDYAMSKQDFLGAAGIADEEARVCLNSGDIETAGVWYKEGHDTALKQPNLTDAQKDLWNFRMENAEARIAVRINEDDDPMKHVAAAKAILDKGNIPEQAAFLPALTGYVAFYQKDNRTALAELQKANQKDPFIQCLIAQSYEALGQKDEATTFYRKAAAATAHNPSGAYAIPFAKKKLGAS
jgi:tetratricopeptide (TPR) repeat protein